MICIYIFLILTILFIIFKCLKRKTILKGGYIEDAENGNTYIRPINPKKNVNINGNIIKLHSNNNILQGQYYASKLPDSNGHTYIHPGKKNHNIYLTGANHINLGANKLCLKGVCITSAELQKIKDRASNHSLANGGFSVIAHLSHHLVQDWSWRAPYDCQIIIETVQRDWNNHRAHDVWINGSHISHVGTRWYRGHNALLLAGNDLLRIRTHGHRHVIVRMRKLFKPLSSLPIPRGILK